MDGFDGLPMSYLGQAMPVGLLPQTDYLQSTSGLQMQDHLSNFDTETYMSADDLTFGLSNGLGHPSFKRVASSFDDPPPEPAVSPFDQTTTEQALMKSPSLDQENKLLSFSMPLYNYTLLDYSFRRTSLTMSAQLHGMFFLAESQWPTNPDAPPPPPELTCYRRNLFQITGSITLPRTLRYIMTDQGDRIPILAQELTVSATESVEDNPVKIISVPWKTPAGAPPTTTEDKAEKEPPSIPLDTMAGADMDADYATFPVQWKRLQFRIATANNGRRKELQQHFVIRLKILAKLSTGVTISIAEAQSGAIIVRGRSPRNFQSRKDLPLSTSAGASRKNLGAGLKRTSTGDSAPQVTPSNPAITSDDVAQGLYQQLEEHDLQPHALELTDWENVTGQPLLDPLPTPDYNHSMMPPQIPSYNRPSPPEGTSMLPLSRPNLAAIDAPLGLPFSNDEEGNPTACPSRPSLPRPPTSNPSLSFADTPKSHSIPLASPPATPLQNPPKQRPRFNSRPASSPSALNVHQNSTSASKTTTTNKPRQSYAGFPAQASSSSPALNVNPSRTSLSLSMETEEATTDPADSLYEYFPLGLDDWLPPVDAVYRSHGVHHHTGPVLRHDMSVIGGVPGVGTESGLLSRKTGKRYFSADD